MMLTCVVTLPAACSSGQCRLGSLVIRFVALDVPEESKEGLIPGVGRLNSILGRLICQAASTALAASKFYPALR